MSWIVLCFEWQTVPVSVKIILEEFLSRFEPGMVMKGRSSIILAAVLVAIATISGCKVDTNAGNTTITDKTTELKPVEIREYEGENLSSISSFRENSIEGPQYVGINSYQLKITGLVESPQSYTYDEVIGTHQNYTKVVTLNCVEGWSVKILWEGVLVRDLLSEAAPLSGAKVVIFHAYDGYTTSLPLDYITGNDIVMAYKMNGVTLPPERGFPFELVAESKWGYKWIKWITEIELSSDENYQGYWESRGYSDSGDLDKSFFD